MTVTYEGETSRIVLKTVGKTDHKDGFFIVSYYHCR